MAVTVQISFRNSATGADDWLDITPYLKQQWPLPNDFGSSSHGVYPDETDTTDTRSDYWYDLRKAIADAANDLAVQAGTSLKNLDVRGQNSMGEAGLSVAERRAVDVKNFFDGRVHAIRVSDSNGGDIAGTDVRIIIESRYTSRNA